MPNHPWALDMHGVHNYDIIHMDVKGPGTLNGIWSHIWQAIKVAQTEYTIAIYNIIIMEHLEPKYDWLDDAPIIKLILILSQKSLIYPCGGVLKKQSKNRKKNHQTFSLPQKTGWT